MRKTLVLITAAVFSAGLYAAVQDYGRTTAGPKATVAATPVSRHVRAAAGRRSASSPNIILVIIDTMRRDHAGLYGYGRKTTPVIDSLAADGMAAEHAVAQAPWTAPSVASMFTSRYPSVAGAGAVESVSGVRDNDKRMPGKLGESAFTLAEALQEGGYYTGCVQTNIFASDEFGMLQGFQKKLKGAYNADKVVGLGNRFMDHAASSAGPRRKPFFLLLHFMDLHYPVYPPPPYDGIFPVRDGKPHKKEHHGWMYSAGDGLGSEEFMDYRSHRVALYDGALSYVDSQLGRLVGHLKEAGLYENTVIVIAADHGEEFWDHAELEKELMPNPHAEYGVGHGHTMFGELLDVPLVFHGPGVPEGSKVSFARNLDIMPTILGLAGLDASGLGLEGVDMLKPTGPGHVGDGLAFSEDINCGYEMKAVQEGRYKYIRGRGFALLYDKVADPEETSDISGREPALARRMDGRLAAVLAGMKPRERKSAACLPGARDALHSLGYLQ
jgi:arylsulfatase A-like enzyme